MKAIEFDIRYDKLTNFDLLFLGLHSTSIRSGQDVLPSDLTLKLSETLCDFSIKGKVISFLSWLISQRIIQGKETIQLYKYYISRLQYIKYEIAICNYKLVPYKY